MTVKKAKGKVRGTAKKSRAKATAKAKKGRDIVQVRESINELVKVKAEMIATEVIKVALTGQLATAKYLFEAVGLYPATEQTTVQPIETSLAHTLLTRMGLPLDPVVCDGEVVEVVKSGAVTEAISVAEEDPEERPEEEKLIQ